MVGLYIFAALILTISQRHILYQPHDGPAEPRDAGLSNFTRHTLPATDGTAITYWESATPADAPLLFYFHGNGGGLYVFTDALAHFSQQGFHVVAMEYPGYPGAQGHPSQTAIIADGITLIDHFKTRQPNTPAILWGYSLGTGVATQLAAQRHPAVLVLEAPFTAVVDRAQELYPFLPVSLLIDDPYRSRDVIAQAGAPVFIMHGTADRIIPVAHGKALFALAHEPKILKIYPEATHLNLRDYGADDDAIAFIREQLKTSR